jgi:hypothetical protein
MPQILGEALIFKVGLVLDNGQWGFFLQKGILFFLMLGQSAPYISLW